MDQQSNIDLDQADEEILVSPPSDAALEAAAGTGGMPAAASIFDVIPSSFGGCC